MGQVTESIFSGERVIIPMAEVLFIEKDQRPEYRGAIIIVFKGTTWNEKDYFNNTVYMQGAEAEEFRKAWCRYRHELEINNLCDLTEHSASVDKLKFPERERGAWYLSNNGEVLPGADHSDRHHYNDWQSKEFAELVSADQRRRNAMWQAVYMFDPESKGRGLIRLFPTVQGVWNCHSVTVLDGVSIGVNSEEAAQNCIDWLTAEGIK